MPVSRRINATESIATERAERKVCKPEQSDERDHEQTHPHTHPLACTKVLPSGQSISMYQLRYGFSMHQQFF